MKTTVLHKILIKVCTLQAQLYTNPNILELLVTTIEILLTYYYLPLCSYMYSMRIALYIAYLPHYENILSKHADIQYQATSL